MDKFLCESKYIDFTASNIQELCSELFRPEMSDIEKAEMAFKYVRDKIPHSFDCKANVVTAKASDVLKYRTGICHAKSNLLAAILRSQGIPTGFCFQYLTLVQDGSRGYCIHAYNAININNKWVRVDARGNKPGVKAEFSLDEPVLAFPAREDYGEYTYNGIYAEPHQETMELLEKADSIEYVYDNLPDKVLLLPDVED